MAEKLGKEGTVSVEEVVVSHAYEMMSLITILERKGIVSKEEIIQEIQAMRARESEQK